MLYRRADIEDVAGAHLLALEAARRIGFGRYIVSATTPFSPGDLDALRNDAPTVVARLFPEFPALYAARGWRMFDGIDRVYVNRRATAELGWKPGYDFDSSSNPLRTGGDFLSPLARAVGSKGYHDTVFADGPYPVA